MICSWNFIEIDGGFGSIDRRCSVFMVIYNCNLIPQFGNGFAFIIGFFDLRQVRYVSINFYFSCLFMMLFNIK